MPYDNKDGLTPIEGSLGVRVEFVERFSGGRERRTPVPNALVRARFTADPNRWVPATGHDHLNQRIQRTQIVSDASQRTNSQGEVTFSIRASTVSEQVDIEFAHNAGSYTISARGSVRVGVPNLVELVSGSNYSLVGSTNTHRRNHYGRANTNRALVNIANDFRRECENASPPIQWQALRYNDMSLSAGGLFDIRANWSSPHITHRTGRHVDISNADNLNSRAQNVLRNIIRRYGGTILDEGDHWHVTF